MQERTTNEGLKIGDKIDRLTIVEDLGFFIKEGTKTKRHYYKCICECGNEIIVRNDKLKGNKIKSCGCSKIDKCKKFNQYYIYDNIVFVKFTNCNEYFICDADDWQNLKVHSWFKSTDGYAKTNIDKKTVSMHRMIMDCPDGMQVDHVFQLRYGVCDNRKSNLRIVNKSQNHMNQTKRVDNTSGKTGVYLDKRNNKWYALIVYNQKRIYSPYYEKKDRCN